MNIIALTEDKYKTFSNNFRPKHYMQTVEYANLMKRYNKIVYLGLEDNNNIVAAVMIIEEKNKYKYGYAPCGFLIDYNNYSLLEIFTEELKKYLSQLNYIYLRLNPFFTYHIFNKNKSIIKSNSNILENMKNIGYIHLENNNNFDNFNAILNIDNTNTIYNNFNRSIKRKIKDSNLMGITYYQDNNIEKFYDLIKKKNNNNNKLEYYQDLIKYFKNDNCKFELYFAKINSEIYLNNYRYILKKEQERNLKLQEKIKNTNTKKLNKIISYKMISDKLINKYKNKVIEASNIFSKYPDGIIVGSCAIIKCDDTIYFIDEGYEEKLRNIYSLNMLKWEIIKKYNNLDYKIFNLGNIPFVCNKNDKYYGIYLSKIGFNPDIYEYCGELDLVVNKYIYTILKKLKR